GRGRGSGTDAGRVGGRGTISATVAGAGGEAGTISGCCDTISGCGPGSAGSRSTGRDSKSVAAVFIGTASSRRGISGQGAVVTENAAVSSQPAVNPAAIPMQTEAS